MTTNDPQFLFITLILPSLTGLVLIAEGLGKIIKSEMQGWLSTIVGIIFIGIAIFTYFIFIPSLN